VGHEEFLALINIDFSKKSFSCWAVLQNGTLPILPKKVITVGTAVTSGPPHRSVREALPTAPLAMNNKQDGEGYRRVASHERNSDIFAAWVLICQVASKCPRGTFWPISEVR